MSGLLVVAVVAGLIAVNAFFVLSEFAMLASRRARLEPLARTDRRAAEILARLESPARLDAYVAVAQVGISISSLVLGFTADRALGGPLAARIAAANLLAPAAAATAATVAVLVAMTLIQISIGESVPKALAIAAPETHALRTIGPMRAIGRLLAPLIALFNGTARLALAPWGGGEVGTESRAYLPEELEWLATESQRAGVLDPQAGALIARAFDLRDRTARQIMVPRNRLVMAGVNTPIDALLARIVGSPYSRLPVYDEDTDDVVGVIHVKDVFRLSRAPGGRLRDAVREVPMLPETVTAHEVWSRLARGRHHMAILLDEFGGTAGIVTLEDILEELVGEVRDEFDDEGERIEVAAEGRAARVRGDVRIEELNDALALDLPVEEAATVSGLVMHALGRMARVDDVVRVGEVELTVRRVRGNWVALVDVVGPSRSDGGPDAASPTAAAR